MDLQSLASQALLDSLRETGLSPRRDGTTVVPGLHELSARFTSASELEQGRARTVQLGLELALDAGERDVIYESLVGVGDNVPEAVQCAVTAFMEVVWRPIQELFGGPGASGVRPINLCTGSDAAGRPEEWTVYPGPVQAAGERRESLLERLSEQPPYTLVFPTLAPSLLPGRLHWMRLVAVRQRDLLTEAEVRLDNQAVPEAGTALAEYPFPSEPGYLLFRQFLILQPVLREPGAATPGDARAQAGSPGRPWWRFWG